GRRHRAWGRPRPICPVGVAARHRDDHLPSGRFHRHARAAPPRPALMTATHWTRVRLIACGVVFAALFGAVGKRAFNLQIKDGERLKGMAEEQYLREIELPPRRGRILDRNGAELASTADVDSIYCNPRRLPDMRDAARRLGRVLGVDARELEKRLGQRRYF